MPPPQLPPEPAQPAPPAAFGIGQREFVVMMALLQTLHAFAIDAMLPALGAMSADLGLADPNRRQLVVGVFLIFAGVGSLLPGALADRFGRRPVVLGSLVCYIALALACALAQDFTTLLVLRGLQALSSAGLSVLPAAIIRDRFEGDRMARLQSMIGMIFMIVPMIAPTIGQGVMVLAGWRWIFGTMAIFAVVLGAWVWWRLPETLHPEFQQPIRPRTIAANLAEAVSVRGSIGYVLGSAIVIGPVFGYINSAQQLVGEHFGAGARFPLLFGMMAMAMAIANFANSRIVEKFGARRVSQSALIAFILTASAQVYLANQPGQTLWQFVPVMTINMCLLGFIGANFGSIALQPFARMAGAAASAHSFLRMVIGALLGAAIGQAFDGSARPLAAALLVCSLAAFALVLYSERGRLFRRLTPPGAFRPLP